MGPVREVVPVRPLQSESAEMKLGTNKYGTPIGTFTCATCSNEYTVCPAPEDPDEVQAWAEAWKNCLSTECPSYDPDRDCDDMFGVVREPTRH